MTVEDTTAAGTWPARGMWQVRSNWVAPGRSAENSWVVVDSSVADTPVDGNLAVDNVPVRRPSDHRLSGHLLSGHHRSHREL
jgi:hypothetical protein